MQLFDAIPRYTISEVCDMHNGEARDEGISKSYNCFYLVRVDSSSIDDFFSEL